MLNNGDCTGWFENASGVKQGDPLFPTLFSLFINDLARQLKSEGPVLQVGSTKINILLYADDMVLLAENEENLQSLLGVMSDWCYKWRLKVNKNKTKIIHRRTARKTPTNVVFKYGNDDLEVVSRYKYLGIVLDEHLKFDTCSRSLAESGRRALGFVISKFRHVKNTGFSTLKKMFDISVKPILGYAGGVWGYIKAKDTEMIQSRAMWYYLGVHRSAPIAGMYGDMGWMKPYMGRYICMIRFWNPLITLENSRLTKQMFNWDYECKTGWSKEIENVFTQLNLEQYFIHKRVRSLVSALNKIQIISLKSGLRN